MVALSTLFVATTAIVGAVAVPDFGYTSSLVNRAVTPNSNGNNSGFWYQFWSTGSSDVTYTNGEGGAFSVVWRSIENFTSGKGWRTAANRNITFSGSFTPGSNGYLSVYTWSTRGESYILENYGPYKPSGERKGTLQVDGGTYDIIVVRPSATYTQYWSIRQQKRSSGTVTTGAHYDKYRALGLPWDLAKNTTYQIVSVEGYKSQGSASITVGEKNSTKA